MGSSCNATPLLMFKGERRTYSGLAQPFPAHVHDHLTLGIVRTGRRELELNGSRCNIQKGDLLIFNPGDVHGCIQTSSELFAYDSIAVSPCILGGTKLSMAKAQNPKARRTFEMLLACLDESNEGKAMKALFTLADLLTLTATKDHTSSHHEDAATKLYTLMSANPANPIVVSEFAEREGLSPYALTRAYKRIYSITPVKHLLSLRIDAACDLLAKGASAAQASAMLGFSDQAHFTRVFKERIGCTPAAYATMHKRGPLSK